MYYVCVLENISGSCVLTAISKLTALLSDRWRGSTVLVNATALGLAYPAARDIGAICQL